MPRKSTASVASAAQTADIQGDVSILSNAPSVNSPVRPITTATINIDPISPPRAKSQAQPSKTAGEKSGRKSAGTAEADEGGGTEKPVKGAGSKAKNDDMTIDDLLLPRSLVSRLSRGSLPPNTSLQKDALLALTKSATVFISYLAHTANSLTSRKTIQAADVLEAIREMELQGIMGSRLEEEIHLFDEGVKGKRKGYRDRVKARESTGTNNAGGQDQDDTTMDVMDEDVNEDDARGPSQSKRVRIADDEPHQKDAGTKIDTNPHPASENDDRVRKASAEASDEEEAEDGQEEGDDEDDEPEDEEEDDEDEEEQDEEPEGEGNEDEEMIDEAEKDTRSKGPTLAPNGRNVIEGSDDDDEDSDFEGSRHVPDAPEYDP